MMSQLKPHALWRLRENYNDMLYGHVITDTVKEIAMDLLGGIGLSSEDVHTIRRMVEAKLAEVKR
jgi:hypothetical protein